MGRTLIGHMGGPPARLFGWSACDWSSPVNNKSISSDKKDKGYLPGRKPKLRRQQTSCYSCTAKEAIFSLLLLLFTPCATLLKPCATLLKPCATLLKQCATLLTPCATLLTPCATLLTPCAAALYYSFQTLCWSNMFKTNACLCTTLHAKAKSCLATSHIK